MNKLREMPPLEPQTCSICLEDIMNSAVQSGCAHACCFTCINEWCKINASCPLCKEPTTWLMDSKGFIHEIEPPKPQPPEEIDAIFIVTPSDEDSLDGFIVPDSDISGEDYEEELLDTEWIGGSGKLRSNLRKRNRLPTRSSKRRH